MTTCAAQGGCPEPAVARVASPLLPGSDVPGFGFAIVRPITSPAAQHGEPLCVEHTHLAIDVMLMGAQPRSDR
jgi:hypothetical protein